MLVALLFQVVYNVGLCICLYDITKLEDSYIFPGDGASHTKGMTVITVAFVIHCSCSFALLYLTYPSFWLLVHFRYVVFHPFLDEVLLGKIKYCSQEGVHGNIISIMHPLLSVHREISRTLILLVLMTLLSVALWCINSCIETGHNYCFLILHYSF